MARKKTASGGTPAVLALEQAGVPHTLHPYTHDPTSDLSYGEEAAAVMADVARAERATGYVAGGISPLGQRTRRLTGATTATTATIDR